jgi:Arc/MetJ-type ribon-helix-helix transcriptional regulator
MTLAARKALRAGRTEKISVSVDRTVLAVIRRRAQRLYGGNVSAVVEEGVLRIREEEGREALVRWLGDTGDASADERSALRAEWGTKAPSVRKRTKTR